VSLAEKQRQLIDDLLVIPDPQERLAAIVERVKNRPPLASAERTEANRIRGCVSLAWLVGDQRDGFCHFRADADSPLVRGLLGLLTDFYSAGTPAEIIAAEPAFLGELEFDRLISPTRLNGLRSAVAAVRAFAAARAGSAAQ
jgi:cysteine desulfuration protein SufE